MKIALSGSGGTGKSTLAEALSNKYDVFRVDEGVRDYLQRNNIGHLRDLPPPDTMRMQREILRDKRGKESYLKNFIADRCTADNVAYMLRWCSRDVTEYSVESYIRDAKEHAQETYDLVLFLPWGKIPLESDGVRSSYLYYQYEIHCLILGLLEDWNLPYVIVKESGLEERVVECSAYIEDVMKNDRKKGNNL